MSFIDDSANNVNRIIETTAAGGVGGFVGRGGKEIDQLFAGPYHPDYSEIEQILQWQIEDRKEKRNWMEDEAGTNYTGTPDPIGGYYDVDTKEARDTYDILFKDAEEKLEFNQNATPLADLEWKSTGWDYDYDEPGEAYKIKDIVYDDKPTYAGENFINQSQINWEIINRG